MKCPMGLRVPLRSRVQIDRLLHGGDIPYRILGAYESAIKYLWLWCLTPFLTIFQLYRGGQFYWRNHRPATIYSLECGVKLIYLVYRTLCKSGVTLTACRYVLKLRRFCSYVFQRPII